MKLTKKITLALGLLAAGTSFAQTQAASNGLLGQRYAEFNFSLVELDYTSDYSYTPGVAVNVPVLPSLLDVGAGYSYTKLRGPIKGHANTIGTYATAYVPLEGVKPFATASLGYEWANLPNSSENNGVWGVDVGVEIPLGGFTITPKIGYSDDFENGFNDGDVWSYSVEGNYWFSPKAAAFASVTKIDLHRVPDDVWNYEVGFRLKF